MKLRSLVGLLAATVLVLGQTQVDLRTQSKDVDFSGASAVKPFPVGTTLPVLCNTGNMFFKIDATAGTNVYGCVSGNTWASEGGGASGQLVVQNAATVLTIGPACTVLSPCHARVGSVVYTYLSAATVTVTAGSGTVYLYVDRSGNLVAGESGTGSPSLQCSVCQLAVSITQFPVDAVPLAVWTATNGTWMSGSDNLALLSEGPSLSAGANVTLTQTGNSVTIAARLATLPSGPQPACAAATGGTMWYTPGGTGIKDNVQVCAKDAADAYAWRTIY